MALIKVQSTRNIETQSITVRAIVPLAEDKCPKTSEGVIIPKSMVTLEDGSILFCLTNRISNIPLNFAEPRVATVSYEDKTVKNKAGADVLVNNISRIEFASTARAVIAEAGKSGASLSMAGLV